MIIINKRDIALLILIVIALLALIAASMALAKAILKEPSTKQIEESQISIVSVIICEHTEETTAILFYSDNTYEVYRVSDLQYSWNTLGMYKELYISTWDDEGNRLWVYGIDGRLVSYVTATTQEIVGVMN